VLGIANGGIALARRLAARLGAKRVGTIDISFYRDDIGRKPIPKEFTPTSSRAMSTAPRHPRRRRAFLRPHREGGARRALRTRPPGQGRARRPHRSRRPQTARRRRLRGLTIDAGDDERVVVRLNNDARPRTPSASSPPNPDSPSPPTPSPDALETPNTSSPSRNSLAEIEQIHATAAAFKKILSAA
jgi:hypothetical protein